MKIFCSIDKIILVLFLSVQFSCLKDADHKNPLDPNSVDFKDVGSISGETLTFFTPFSPLSNVEVSLELESRFIISDAQGQFFFQDLPSGQYLISASKSGFAPVSDSIIVQLGETTHIQLNLDAMPSIDSVAIFSCHVRRVFPANDLFFLEVIVNADDPDGTNDVSLVEFGIPEIGFSDTLDVTQTLGSFRKIIVEAELPVANLENLLGRQMFVRVADRAGSTTESQPLTLARVISETPQVESPNEFELLHETNPLLTWRAIELAFDYSFRIEVVRFQLGLETVVWTQEGISDLATTISVEPSLTSGSYFWTVSVVDQFGNWSRSLQASFRIN